MEIEKLIRDGKVALILSPDFGAGWSTWGPDEWQDFLLFDKTLCEAVEQKDWDAVRTRVESVAGEGSVYFGGMDECELEWVKKGTPFYIHEYDGNEWVVTDFKVA